MIKNSTDSEMLTLYPVSQKQALNDCPDPNFFIDKIEKACQRKNILNNPFQMQKQEYVHVHAFSLTIFFFSRCWALHSQVRNFVIEGVSRHLARNPRAWILPFWFKTDMYSLKQNLCLAPDQKMVKTKKVGNDQKINLAS